MRVTITALFMLLILGLSHNAWGRSVLTWSDNSWNEQGFYVERAASSTSAFARIAMVGEDIETYTDPDGAEGMCYKLQAYNTEGQSDYSNTACLILKAPVGMMPPLALTSVTMPDVIPGLVASYKFNEGAGTVATDSSNNNHSGTLVNAGWTPAGKYGSAVSLNGTSGYVRVDTPGWPTGEMTWVAWVFPNVISGWRAVLEIQTSNSTGIELVLNAGKPEVWSNGAKRYTATAALPVNVWTHLALVRLASTVTLYQNGVALGTWIDTSMFSWGTCPGLIGVDSDSGCSSALNGWFQGIIDSVEVHSVAKTTAQIQFIMNQP